MIGEIGGLSERQQEPAEQLFRLAKNWRSVEPNLRNVLRCSNELLVQNVEIRLTPQEDSELERIIRIYVEFVIVVHVDS